MQGKQQFLTASKEELAWAGGLFEGEGSISDARNCPVIAVDMTDEDTVRRFYEIIGFGNVNGPYLSKTRTNRKPHWTWRVSGLHRVQAVIAALWPWLGKRRKQQVRAVIAKSLFVGIRGENKRKCNKGHSFHPKLDPLGYRYCATCRNIKRKEKRRLAKAKRSSGLGAVHSRKIHMRRTSRSRFSRQTRHLRLES